VLVVAIVFILTKLPEIEEEQVSESSVAGEKSLFKERHLILGVIAQFCYVAAQTGVFSYLINFVTDVDQKVHFDVNNGPYFLSIGFALFMIGRMSGSYLMKFFKPTNILAVYAIMCCLLLPVVTANMGWISIIALYCIFFFMSIMFPTIFALAIKDLGPRTKKASSFLIMSIVGGAVFPLLMGYIADLTNSISIGFLAPIPLFGYIVYYALSGHKVKNV
jgi:FHS family L-fucose permease-like MFS transporter